MRITAHQVQRPTTWRTVEAPLAAAQALRGLEPGSVVLLDCFSLLVSNLLLAHEQAPGVPVEHEIGALLDAVR